MEAVEKLKTLCRIFPEKLGAISESDFRSKREGKWSKAEILGHLIDSAANNHHRFVRSQIESNPIIFYDQNAWVSCQDYQNEDRNILIHLWSSYNQHLIHVISKVQADKIDSVSYARDPNTPLTLSFLVDDYVKHLEHHLAQIFDSEYLSGASV